MTSAIRRQQMHQQELFASAGIVVIILTAIGLGVAVMQRMPYLSATRQSSVQSVQQQSELRARMDALEARVSRIESRLIRGTEIPADQSMSRGPGSNRAW